MNSSRGADVVIVPDNDDAGRAHARTVAASLQGIAANVRRLDLLNLPPKGDIIDWAAAGGTVEKLHALIERSAKSCALQEKAESFPPTAEDSDRAGIRRSTRSRIAIRPARLGAMAAL